MPRARTILGVHSESARRLGCSGPRCPFGRPARSCDSGAWFRHLVQATGPTARPAVPP